MEEQKEYKYRVTLTSGVYFVSTEKNIKEYREALLTGAYGIVTGQQSIQVSRDNFVSLEDVSEDQH